MRLAVLSALLVGLAACSSQPVAQQSASPAPASVPPAPEAQVTVPAPAENAASAKKSGKIPSGYRRETRNGKELFCRNETTLGSRFPQKTCFTREQLEEIQQRTESAMDGMEQGLRVCGGTRCAGNVNN